MKARTVFSAAGLGGFLVASAIVFVCATAPSPNMRSLEWMPKGVAAWADANPAFRNFPAFALLGFLGCLAVDAVPWEPRKKPALAKAFAVSALVSIAGVALELVQLRIHGRFFDPNDIAWSVSGAFAGTVAALPFFWLGRWLRHDG